MESTSISGIPCCVRDDSSLSTKCYWQSPTGNNLGLGGKALSQTAVAAGVLPRSLIPTTFSPSALILMLLLFTLDLRSPVGLPSVALALFSPPSLMLRSASALLLFSPLMLILLSSPLIFRRPTGTMPTSRPLSLRPTPIATATLTCDCKATLGVR